MNLHFKYISKFFFTDNIVQRIHNVNEYFTFSLYSNVCRSLSEKHKLLVSFLVCVRILQNEDKIDIVSIQCSENWIVILKNVVLVGLACVSLVRLG